MTMSNCYLKPMLLPAGSVLTDFNQTRLFDKIKAMIHDLSIERRDCT